LRIWRYYNEIRSFESAAGSPVLQVFRIRPVLPGLQVFRIFCRLPDASGLPDPAGSPWTSGLSDLLPAPWYFRSSGSGRLLSPYNLIFSKSIKMSYLSLLKSYLIC